MTIEEHCKKPLNKVKVVFPGDVRNNMCYAWMIGAAKMGMHFVAMGPEELARQMDQAGGAVHLCRGPEKRRPHRDHRPSRTDLKGADVIYGDVWASMGEEAQIPERVRLLSPFRVTEETLKATENPDVLYLHCLPSFHDFETKMAKEWHEKGVDIREVTDEVFRCPPQRGFRRGGEPDALHQGRDGGHHRRINLPARREGSHGTAQIPDAHGLHHPVLPDHSGGRHHLVHPGGQL